MDYRDIIKYTEAEERLKSRLNSLYNSTTARRDDIALRCIHAMIRLEERVEARGRREHPDEWAAFDQASYEAEAENERNAERRNEEALYGENRPMTGEEQREDDYERWLESFL